MDKNSSKSIIQRFLFKVQNNPDFFNYFNVEEDEAMELALRRTRGYLSEALSVLTLKCSPDVDFKSYDEELEEFPFDIVESEIELIATIMFELFLAKDIAKLRVHNNLLTSQDLKSVYGVGYAERRSFVEMYEKTQTWSDNLIDGYIARDRLTGKRKTIIYDL